MTRWLLVLLWIASCGSHPTPPAAQPAAVDPAPSLARSSDDPVRATADTPVDVHNYPARLVVPAGWGYLHSGDALITQAPDRSAGLFVFGVDDKDQMSALLAKLFETLGLDAGGRDGVTDTVVLHGVTFQRLSYPGSTVKTHPAAVVVGFSQRDGHAVIVFVTYLLASSGEQARLAAAADSIAVTDGR